MRIIREKRSLFYSTGCGRETYLFRTLRLDAPCLSFCPNRTPGQLVGVRKPWQPETLRHPTFKVSPDIEHFQFEMLRISNNTACRFAETTRFSALFWPGNAGASRSAFFNGKTLQPGRALAAAGE